MVCLGSLNLFLKCKKCVVGLWGSKGVKKERLKTWRGEGGTSGQEIGWWMSQKCVLVFSVHCQRSFPPKLLVHTSGVFVVWSQTCFSNVILILNRVYMSDVRFFPMIFLCLYFWVLEFQAIYGWSSSRTQPKWHHQKKCTRKKGDEQF